jgi:NADH:ubiquinone oxidoreductase subunit F (NADH-binding)
VGHGPADRDPKRLLDQLFAGQAPPPDHDRREGGERPLWQIDVYDDRHGAGYGPYDAVRNCLQQRDPEAILKALDAASLFGMGGAAARVGVKWRDVLKAHGDHKYVVCNGDESEPGTFKDRELLLHAPHLVIEGMLLAGLLLRAAPGPADSAPASTDVSGYVYIRHEYGEQIEAVGKAIEEARKQVPEALTLCPLEVFVSPGAYICGEESALLEAIEGRRAQPRNSPPNIRTNGLFDKPTVVNNVETFAWVPAVMLREQGKWYAEQLLRFFSVSGDVQKPGVFESSVNCTLGELIDRAGGMRDGMTLKAVAPSGPSGGFLPRYLRNVEEMRQALGRGLPSLEKRSKPEFERVKRFLEKGLPAGVDKLDIRQLPLDVALFRSLKLALGAGIVVYGEKAGEKVYMLDHARNCLEFFAKESCGKCVPCRLGCQQLVHLAEDLGDEAASDTARTAALARDLGQVMEATSICGLGRTAAKPLLTVLGYFGAEPPSARAAEQP